MEWVMPLVVLLSLACFFGFGFVLLVAAFGTKEDSWRIVKGMSRIFKSSWFDALLFTWAFSLICVWARPSDPRHLFRDGTIDLLIPLMIFVSFFSTNLFSARRTWLTGVLAFGSAAISMGLMTVLDLKPYLPLAYFGTYWLLMSVMWAIHHFRSSKNPA